MGGVAMLQALSSRMSTPIMNEGHAEFLTLALLEREAARGDLAAMVGNRLRSGSAAQRIYHSHAGAAGHDHSPPRLSARFGSRALGGSSETPGHSRRHAQYDLPALHLSRYVNGVAMRYGETFPLPVSRSRHRFDYPTGSSPDLDRRAVSHLYEPLPQPRVRRDSFYLRYAIKKSPSRRSTRTCPRQTRNAGADRPADQSASSENVLTIASLDALPAINARFAILPTGRLEQSPSAPVPFRLFSAARLTLTINGQSRSGAFSNFRKN